jgi:eukaryotic-like serine/threonine-protein kinase
MSPQPQDPTSHDGPGTQHSQSPASECNPSLPAAVPAISIAEYHKPKAGTIIGRYKLIQIIGEGGMGSVWMAEQTEPVRRNVALKLIQSAMVGSQELTRFEIERQALALMDHQNIARVLDAGTTDTGRPFFVMELVKGIPITKYCDQHKMVLRQRLRLFIQVCHAIQHAHQKGIIHRDIKPSNVLVAEYDGEPVPKVIDFGLAKATGLKLTDHSLATNFGTVLGTLQYMSPEQAELNALDIDTRSDIYALGVLLYELLTGSTPVTNEQMKKSALYEVLRQIREEEPPSPSTRLSQSGAVLASVAAQRGIEPPRLAKLLRGELDWLVMKALEKDRNRRYETANSFALDVQRYLQNEPVLAGPPSASYRLRKFAKRNQGPLAAAAVILLALVGGIIGTTWGMRNALAARAAEAARAEGERQAKIEAEAAALDAKKANAQAQKRLAQIEKGNEIITSIFTDLDVRKITNAGAEPLEAVLAARLAKAAGELEEEAVGDALVVATLQNRLGKSLLSLGHAREAVPLMLKALATCKAQLGPDHSETLSAMNTLSMAYMDSGNVELAMPLLEETFKMRQAKLGEDDPDTLTTMNNLASGYLDAGKVDAAVSLWERSLPLMKVRLGLEHPSTLVCQGNLAVAYESSGQLVLALPLFEDALRLLSATLGKDHPDTLSCMNNLAKASMAAGNIDRALSLAEQSLKLTKAKLGADHSATLHCMNNLAHLYRDAGRLDLAVPLSEDALKLTTAKLGEDHPTTLASMSNLASIWMDSGKPELAIPLFEKALTLCEEKLGADHPDTLRTMNNLANCYHRAGKPDLALPLFEESLQLLKAKLGDDHADTLRTMNNLALTYQAVGKLNLTLSLIEECLRLTKAKLGDDHPETLRCMSNLAMCYGLAGKSALALPLFEETLKLSREKLGLDHPDTLRTINNLASAYQKAGKLDLALPLYEENVKLTRAKLGQDHPNTLTCMNNLALGYQAAGKLDQALPLFDETLKLRRNKLGPDNPETITSLHNLAWAYGALGKLDLAVSNYLEAATAVQRLRFQHVQAGSILTNLAGSYEKLQQFELAEPWRRKWLAVVKLSSGADSVVFANELAVVGRNLLEQKKWSEAEPMLRDCLRIREREQPDAWTTFNTQSMLGAAFLGQQQYADAEPLLLKGYEGMKQRAAKIPQGYSIRLTEAIQRLVGLYEAKGNQEAAARWQKELNASKRL